jgi:hypothetical protein
MEGKGPKGESGSRAASDHNRQPEAADLWRRQLMPIVDDNPHDLTTLALTDAEADLLFALVQHGIMVAQSSPEEERKPLAPILQRLADRLKRCP